MKPVVKQVDTSDAVSIKCCGCPGTVMFSRDTSKSPTFFHTLPYCKRFYDTETIDELLEYMQDCRKMQEN